MRLGAILIMLSFICLAGGPEAVKPPVSGLESTLEDVAQDLPGGRTRWSTYWRLCWTEYTGARAYELQAQTIEGVSTNLRRQTDGCFRIEVAAGENAKSQGFLNRDLLLTLQSAQLSYRVRAVLDSGRFSEWSRAVPAGKRVPTAPR
jgi:hypothetical protein